MRVVMPLLILLAFLVSACASVADSPASTPATSAPATTIAPSSDTSGVDMSDYDNRPLFETMRQSLNIEHLQDLAFALNLDYEDLPGSTKSAKARELILYLERRGRAPELLEALTRMWPDVDWYEIAGTTLHEKE